MQVFKGVGSALITPFTDSNSIDFDGLKKLLDFNAKNGVDFFVVNGTTGESATTTSAEKSEILAFVKNNNTKNLPIMYGIGGNNTQEVTERISNTDLQGVGAILSVCPYYVKPSQQGLYEHFIAIADASPVPVFLYNVPGRTVASIHVSTVAKLAEHPNIIGLKDASCSIEEAMKLTKACPKDFILVSGDDNLVTAQLSLGYQGVISVISNGFPKEFSELTHAGLAGDFKKATELQLRFLDFDNLLYVESNPVGIKAVCEIRGISSSRVRLPLAEASESLKTQLIEAMKREKFIS
ncbi:MAG: 4-hydroxy-tetrahydrodipicolinate synthase [Leadbetterella sp.]